MIRRIVQQFFTGLILLLAIAPAMIAQTSERGVLLLLRGRPTPPAGMTPEMWAQVVQQGKPTDTLMIDRFERVGDTLRGRLDVIAEGAYIDYWVLLGPGNTVRQFMEDGYRPSDPNPARRERHTRIAIGADSMIVTGDTAVRRLSVTPDIVPMFPAALALNQLLTTRAQSRSGNADIPVYWIRSGTTYPATVRRQAGDTLAVTVFGTPPLFRVDSTGRILGGAGVLGNVYVRGTPDAGMALIKTRLDPVPRRN